MSKGLSKYIIAFEYLDKTISFLTAIRGEISIASFAVVIGAPTGMARSNFSFAFRSIQDS